MRGRGKSAAHLEHLMGGAEGVEGAPHLRHPILPRLLRPVVVLVAVAIPAKRQRHHLLSPPPHRRRRRLTVPHSLFSLRWSDRSRKSTGRRKWKVAAASRDCGATAMTCEWGQPTTELSSLRWALPGLIHQSNGLMIVAKRTLVRLDRFKMGLNKTDSRESPVFLFSLPLV
jgi:hypothetical protein